MTKSSAGWLAAMMLMSGAALGFQPAQSAPQGRGGGPAAQPTYAYGWKSEEYLLRGNTNRGAGEPMIAVDPTNPKNIVAVAMASLQQVDPNGPARGALGRSTITTLAVTHDGGFTWKTGELPILYNDTLRCPDSFLTSPRTARSSADARSGRRVPANGGGSFGTRIGDDCDSLCASIGIAWGISRVASAGAWHAEEVIT